MTTNGLTPCRTVYRFKIREILDADDALSRWIAVVSVAINDLIIAVELMPDDANGARQRVYAWRIVASHLHELRKYLRRAEEDQAITDFIAGLDSAVRYEYERAKALGDELKSDLARLRDAVFHYWHDGHKALSRVLAELADSEEDEIEVALGPALADYRSELAESIAAALMYPELAENPQMMRQAFEAFTKKVLRLQVHLLRFAQGAIISFLENGDRTDHVKREVRLQDPAN